MMYLLYIKMLTKLTGKYLLVALRISNALSTADNFSHDWTDKNAGVLVDGSINSGRECEITRWKGSENGHLDAASLT